MTKFPSAPSYFSLDNKIEWIRLFTLWRLQIEQWNAENGNGGTSAIDAQALAKLSYATVISETRDLPKSRLLTAGTGITLTDAGAGSTLTIASTPNTAPIFGTPQVKTITDSPYTIATSQNVFLDASASAGADFIANLPHATGSGFIVVVKKTDANAHNVAITPDPIRGTDTIDGLNAARNLANQYDAHALIDVAAGKWDIWS